MDVLQEWAATRAEELPGVTVDQPFGPEVDVYRVRERMFMALSPMGRTSVTLKAAPEDAEALRETFPAIIPGYHMNKRHWITLRADGSLEQDLVRELVTEAYRLVVAKLPRAQRPVDPELFGRL
ncbi:MmcQ/YjbR family DNA-binding protein [Microbacterium azadirachtae]|uniref:MmcQ/YjbR family DNA-binding protein n=1 Tax=Microbacterium azadirachtae TaxID=582680 RepID=UPI00088F8E3F|nr:MmcQ/YjbR family DNA-binding protein [Microbacterium azadirachtae]SDL33911.1 Predicted DNA-binding protein, MmcQ/YjbR family [Microbacterium azadirachtae]SEF64234.1 Predicted DNA-binding protein, MmcQ/YjbR family [Microbacterium azadirachtae]SEF65109.1 Predicted DNA-binding protein, MmcQ/YjbR family [Microbacterium azadirachtae]